MFTAFFGASGTVITSITHCQNKKTLLWLFCFFTSDKEKKYVLIIQNGKGFEEKLTFSLIYKLINIYIYIYPTPRGIGSRTHFMNLK